MRIVFIGAVEFSRHCLEEIIRNGGQVVAVFTLDPAKAKRHADFADLTPSAQQHGIPIFYVDNINEPQNITHLRELRPGVIFIFGWSQIVGPELRAIAPCIGTHPALLPRNRGRHPIVWALVHGLKESGLTFFYIDEGIDSGDILWQRPFAITPEDDAGTLLKKIEQLASEAIAEFLPQLKNGTAQKIPQDHSLTNYWRKRSAADGEIDWKKSSGEIHDLIRALAKPYPGAHTFCGGKKIVVRKSRLPPGENEPNALPGAVVSFAENSALVQTGSGLIELVAWEGGDFAVGSRLGAC